MKHAPNIPYHDFLCDTLTWKGIKLSIEYLNIFDDEGFYDATEVVSIDSGDKLLSSREKEIIIRLWIRKIYRQYNKYDSNEEE